MKFSSELEEGGAIRKDKVRKRSPKRNEKIMQALAASSQKGGAIRKDKVRKRSPKRNEKIMQALAASSQKGGTIKFHDKQHEYLYKNLSGKGARYDSPMCRKMMYGAMSKCHPSLFNSYLHGRVRDIPHHKAHHLFNTPQPFRRDAQADIIDRGGSLLGITHSENGLLRVHNGEFHHRLEIV